MKTKILLSFTILFFAAITTNAQISEGKYLLGGSFNFYSSDNPKSNSSNLNIQLGKAIKEIQLLALLALLQVQIII